MLRKANGEIDITCCNCLVAFKYFLKYFANLLFKLEPRLSPGMQVSQINIPLMVQKTHTKH